MRLAVCLLAFATAAAAAAAQPYAVTESLGPLRANVQGLPTGLVPLSAAPDSEGFVVLAMVPGHPPARPLRAHLVALRLDAAGAVTQTRPLSALGAVTVILEPRVAARLHPDGDGFLFGAVFDGVGLRAVRLGPDLAAEVVAERRFPNGLNLTLHDAVRLAADAILFVGDNLRGDGYDLRTEPLALIVNGEGAERALVELPAWSEAVTDVAVLPGAVVLAGWTDEGGDRAYLVRTFDASAQPTGARRLTTDGYPTDARLVGLGEGRALLAAPAADSSGHGRNRMVAAVVGAPGGTVQGSAFAGEPSDGVYTVEAVWGLDALGLALVGTAPAGEAGRRLLLASPPATDAPGWTLAVASPGTVRPLARGTLGGTATVLSAHAPAAPGAARDSAWHLERTVLHAAPPPVPWLAPLAGSPAPDAAAHDAYLRAALAAPDAAGRGAALRAYGDALDARADSAAVSRELQRQAAALLDAGFDAGADVLLGGGARLLLRTRPGLSDDRQRCIATLFLWTRQADRAAGEAATAPERPATPCGTVSR